MVFGQHIADDVGGFFVRFVRCETGLVHGIENAAMHRLESVADVRQSTAGDNAHRIVDEGILHFVFQNSWQDLAMGKVFHGWCHPPSRIRCGTPRRGAIKEAAIRGRGGAYDAPFFILIDVRGWSPGFAWRRGTFERAKHPTRKASGAKSHRDFRGPTLFWSGPPDP